MRLRYRDLEEMMLERDLRVDHTTIYRWVQRYAPEMEHPSYGFQLAHGATTLTEKWDGPVRGDSQNHLMLGHIEEWFYSGLAGIRVDYAADPVLTIKPAFIDDLCWVKARQDVLGGRVTVSWEREIGGRFQLAVTIPANMTALLSFPTSDFATLFEGGGSIEQCSGITALCLEGKDVVCKIKSGTYALTGTFGTAE